MARKADGTATTTRRKKTQTTDSPAAVQVTPDVRLDVHEQVRKDVPRNGTPANYVPVNLASANIEEQIRHRAYELYLQRRATAGGESGDQNQDWLIAEREIRSSQGGQKQFGMAAGGAQA